uniref:Uncharacterized protein n=1 Tax=Peronospora matthiolae TaxID=2874970 RepID=A0AAV1VN12_9STRA
MSDIEMDSVGLRPNGSLDYGHDHRKRGDKRIPHVATAGAAESGGFGNQRIRMTGMAKLKDFSGRENNEERAELDL